MPSFLYQLHTANGTSAYSLPPETVVPGSIEPPCSENARSFSCHRWMRSVRSQSRVRSASVCSLIAAILLLSVLTAILAISAASVDRFVTVRTVDHEDLALGLFHLCSAARGCQEIDAECRVDGQSLIAALGVPNNRLSCSRFNSERAFTVIAVLCACCGAAFVLAFICVAPVRLLHRMIVMTLASTAFSALMSVVLLLPIIPLTQNESGTVSASHTFAQSYWMMFSTMIFSLIVLVLLAYAHYRRHRLTRSQHERVDDRSASVGIIDLRQSHQSARRSRSRDPHSHSLESIHLEDLSGSDDESTVIEHKFEDAPASIESVVGPRARPIQPVALPMPSSRMPSIAEPPGSLTATVELETVDLNETPT